MLTNLFELKIIENFCISLLLGVIKLSYSNQSFSKFAQRRLNDWKYWKMETKREYVTHQVVSTKNESVLDFLGKENVDYAYVASSPV